ncbi:MAG: nucleotidyl transferase AbiEii/AbiGii toxin family protein [Rhodobacteraceae bacterium]|nr:nucleotidyl transferase AbiEii/AbiGii toxin family protein [Paracoccaceae bacterium]
MRKLTDISQQVVDDNPQLQDKETIIEKEILHFDILRCLESQGYLDELTFIGGTALRLCHGSLRYSEDLDFDGGVDFAANQMAGLEEAIRSDLTQRYGHDVQVLPPKARRFLVDVAVSTWRISVVTRPERADMPRQRIHLDIAPMSGRDPETLPVQNHYPILSSARRPFSVRVKSKDSILADKIVACSSSILHRRQPRWRDLWDMNWLAEQGTQVNSDLVMQRAVDAGIADVATQIDAAADRISGLVDSPGFREQLSRFLDNDTAKQTVHDPVWREQAGKKIRIVFDSFYPPPNKPPALHTAARMGDIAALRRRLDAGEEPDRLESPQTKKITALHWATGNNQAEATHLLISRRADVNAVNHKGWAILHYAAHYAAPDIVQNLLTTQPNPHSLGPDGSTALHWAVRRKAPQDASAIVMALLDAGVDPKVRDERDRTALMIGDTNPALSGTDGIKRLREVSPKPAKPKPEDSGSSFTP